YSDFYASIPCSTYISRLVTIIFACNVPFVRRASAHHRLGGDYMFGNYRSPAAVAVGMAAASLAVAGSAQAETLTQLEARIAALEAKEQEPVQVTNRYGMALSFYGTVKVDAVMDNNYGLGNNIGALA